MKSKHCFRCGDEIRGGLYRIRYKEKMRKVDVGCLLSFIKNSIIKRKGRVVSSPNNPHEKFIMENLKLHAGPEEDIPDPIEMPTKTDTEDPIEGPTEEGDPEKVETPA